MFARYTEVDANCCESETYLESGKTRLVSINQRNQMN